MKKTILCSHLLFLFSYAAISQTGEEFYQKALEAFKKEDYKVALTTVNKALKTDSFNFNYLMLKGNSLDKLDKVSEAFDVYTIAVSKYPKNSEVYNQRGLVLMRVQESDFAINDFSMALDFENVDSSRLKLLLNRGAAKIYKRDFEGAYEDFLIALKIDSLSIGILNNLATVCDEVGKGELTLSYLHKIVSIDPTFVGAYVNIGFKYQGMGEYAKSITYFNKVIELKPDEPLAFSNRAYSKYKLEDYKGAMSDINLSIKLYPTNPYAFRNRALIYLAKKNDKKACEDIDEALRLGFTKMYGEEVEQLKKQHCSK